MESLKAIAARQQKDGPVYFKDPARDHLLKLLLELAEEICVLRDRLETAACLAASGQNYSSTSIDSYEFSAEETEKRLAAHQAFFEDLFKRLPTE